MGGLGDDEELAQLVRDYLESPIPGTDHLEKCPKLLSPVLSSLQELLGEMGEEETEIQQKVTEYMYEEDNYNREMSMKKLVFKLKSDGYDASLCRTTWDSSFDRREGCQVFRFTGNYEYIDVITVSDNGDKEKKRVIIDLDFKCQFELAKPSERYKAIIQILPKVLVATEERLKTVISLLCTAMKRSMKEEGLHMPPWRTLEYMQAKWLSENRERVSESSRGSDGYDDDDDGASGDGDGDGGGDGGGDAQVSCCLSIF